MSNTASRTRSEVGRTFGPVGPARRLPRNCPPITRTRPAYRRTFPPSGRPRASVSRVLGRPRPRHAGGPLALEEELCLAVLDEDPQLVDQLTVALETRVPLDQGHGHGTGLDHQVPIGQELPGLEIPLALLPRPDDGPLAAQFEVGVGQLDPVAGPTDRRRVRAGRR